MLTREISIRADGATVTTSGDLVVRMAFASEQAVQRWFGIEILEVSEQAIRLQRLNDGAALLYNHNWNDLRGVHEPGTARVENDKVLRGDVRITSATQAGRDTIELVRSGVLTKASIGYQIHKVIEVTKSRHGGQAVERPIDGAAFEDALARCEAAGTRSRGVFTRELDARIGARIDRADDDEPVYRIIDWEPLENSLVTVPADRTVGVGRSGISATIQSQPATSADSGGHMTQQAAAAGASAEQSQQQQQQQQQQQNQGAGDASVVDQNTREQLERRRGIALTRLAADNGIEHSVVETWIERGLTATQAGEEVLRILEERGRNPARSPAALGMSRAETQQYSLLRAIRAANEGNWGKAGLELEAHQEIQKRLGTLPDPKKFYVPLEVQARAMPDQIYADLLARMMGKRALDVATPASAGYLVGTNNQGFIEMLRNRAVVFRMGARRLGGLVGNVTVPRQTGAATAQWLDGEADELTETLQVLSQLSLAPKTVGAYTEISRQLMLQSSPDVESMVMADLAAVTALAVDKAALEGTGADGQPTGISATSGIGAVTGTSLAYAGILEFQTDVASANVTPARGGYATTPAVAALLKQRVKFSGTASPLWEGNIWDGEIEGFPAMSSNQLAAATMVFGDWESLVVAEWGVLEIEINPFANFQAGITGVRAMYSVDVGVRRAAAFSRASSIT